MFLRRGFLKTLHFQEKMFHLKVFFTELKKQTGYFFLYSDVVLSKAKPVTIDATNEQFDNFLKRLFANQPLTYSLKDKNVIVAPAKKIAEAF